MACSRIRSIRTRDQPRPQDWQRHRQWAQHQQIFKENDCQCIEGVKVFKGVYKSVKFYPEKKLVFQRSFSNV